MPSLSLHWLTFLVPKDGHAAAECEDAVGGHPATRRFAIADGASESYAAGEWARLLVDAYLATGPAGNWLAAPQAVWKKIAVGSAVSWYAEEKFTRGGHATFLGVTVQLAETSGEWAGIAFGDACLFEMSHGALLSTFPLSRSSQFNSSPSLVSSRGGQPAWAEGGGTLQAGDVLLLATDALAQFLFESEEEGNFAGRDLAKLEHADDFALWVAAQRASGRLRNDDVAIGILEIRES
jgi:hypothetical protein